MKGKKRQFHCQKCGSPADIYKKGKAHRVLVCPHCGVLATNPLALAPLAISAGVSALSSLTGKKEHTPPTPASSFPRETYSTEERVRDALR